MIRSRVPPPRSLPRSPDRSSGRRCLPTGFTAAPWPDATELPATMPRPCVLRTARLLVRAARRPDRPRQNWCQRPLPGLAPRCAARPAPWPRWPGGHRGSCAGWPASQRPPAAAEQPESARLEVSESSTSLTGESRSDATDADASVLDPTFTSCLGNPQRKTPIATIGNWIAPRLTDCVAGLGVSRRTERLTR